MKRLKFLGHEIDETGIHIDSSRLQAITTYKKPTNAKEVRSFLGFAGWHRKFIKDYAEMTATLVDLTKKGVEFVWTQEHESAYQNVKSALLNAPFLSNPDYSIPFHIDSTSSAIGISAILYQVHSKEKRIIAYMSSKLNELQRKYHIVERECLALIVALEKFRHYIEGNKIIVTTDQCSLNWLRNCKDPTGRIARWSIRLQAYDFELKTKQFPLNDPVNILSKEIDVISAPCSQLKQFEDIELPICPCPNVESDCTQSDLSIIDICDVTKTQDKWYASTYESIKANSKNDYYKIQNDILYHRFDKIKHPFEHE